MKYDVVLLAAGKGSRTQLEYNKIFYEDEMGKSIIEKSAQPFIDDVDCIQVWITTTQDEIEFLKQKVNHKKVHYVMGGATRQESVYNALQNITSPYVMIHDGARCFLQKKTIEACKKKLLEKDACLVMVQAIDTLKRVQNGEVVETIVRNECYHAQTPQCFASALIKECYEKGKQEGFIATDDTSLVEEFSDVKIAVVEGEYTNIKITTPQDLKSH